MISIESLFYKIDQKLDKLASNAHQWISPEDKVLALNEAQIKLIKQKLDGNNIYKLGLDAFKKRYQDLQKFVEDYSKHPLNATSSDSNLNKYTVSLSGLDPKYMFYMDSYLITSKGKCKNRIVYVNNDLVKHADLTILLTNSNYKPSFEYQETFSISSSDELWYFTDGSFKIDKVYLSYLRYPAYIAFAGFELPDGTVITNQQDCELEEYLEDELVDLAVKDLASYIENTIAVQASTMRIADNE